MAEPGAEDAKTIVLFSDGTGNSSAKLFKTNVWRMYEAVDLGADANATRQIVYYDEGVGNSALRPLAMLGGIFGWGLKRNVIELYAFLCRNYHPGDRIYAFGFSRGAFTIRLLVGLIADQGVVRYIDEADLSHQSADAFRNYINPRIPRFPPMLYILPAWRKLVALLLSGKRGLLGQRRYDQMRNYDARVRFVGVWDTVAAYGGPLAELVRGFDDWIRPLTFQNHRLSDKVDFARHALALDDERDAFQPVPWDESADGDRDRLKQVWFTGMHADVGGGYPDDSLAYVSLAWMMREAGKAGLALRQDKVAEANRTANAFGPLHDSRSGWGSYYRYQPRIVGAYVEPPSEGTESIADPQYEDEGLRRRALIDQSVLCRIAAGTDGYAPITLPRDFRIVADDAGTSPLPAGLQQTLDGNAERRADRQEALHDLVWWRRVLYFSTVLASLVLATLPLWVDALREPLCRDARCYLATVFGWLRLVLPDFAEPWVKAYTIVPGFTATMIVAIVALRAAGAAVERSLRDRTRGLWRLAFSDALPQPPVLPDPDTQTVIRAVRTSRPYQGFVRVLKWTLLPTVFGIGMLLAMLWAGAAVVTQVRLGTGEKRGLFCDGGSPAAGINFDTARSCNPMGVAVERGQSYELLFFVRRPWSDGTAPVHPASPLGLGAGDYRWGLGYLGAPFRRVVDARYLQPLVAIRAEGASRAIDIEQMAIVKITDTLYRAEFTAQETGLLSLFVNDAVPPFGDAAFFYRGHLRTGNAGTACVAISRKLGDVLHPLIGCASTCAEPVGPCSWQAVAPRVARPEDNGVAAGAVR